MRKLMLLAAMLAMVLVAAAPALAQDATAGDEGDATGGDVTETTTETQYTSQVLDCDVVIGDISQGQYGDATASGDEAVAEIANEQGVSIEVVQTCIAAGEDASVNLATGEVVAADGTDGADGADGVDNNGDGVVDEAGETASDSASDSASVLPATGGASLFTLGAGALLVGGGLLARRIFS